VGDQRDCLIDIARFAGLLARLRGIVGSTKDRNVGDQETESSPDVIEKPDRINQLFYNLCRGHAVVCGRSHTTTDDVRLIATLALDSAPPTRAKMVRGLIEKGGELRTAEAEKLLGCSKPYALGEMRTLCSLGICAAIDDLKGLPGQPSKKLVLAEKFAWLKDRRYVELLARG
jgi:hypothetical protein